MLAELTSLLFKRCQRVLLGDVALPSIECKLLVIVLPPVLKVDRPFFDLDIAEGIQLEGEEALGFDRIIFGRFQLMHILLTPCEELPGGIHSFEGSHLVELARLPALLGILDHGFKGHLLQVGLIEGHRDPVLGKL